MNKSTYFTQYGAEDYNIFANANKSKSYVLSRFMDDPEGAYFMLFEHAEGCEGVNYYMFERLPESLPDIPENVLNGIPDGEYSDGEFAKRINGHSRFVHNIHIRRLLHHSKLGA